MLAVSVKSGEHPVIRGLQWILENRTQADGKKLSMRALSLAAELSPGYVEQIINGRQSPDLAPDKANALAKAGDVSAEWLVNGGDDPGQYAAESTPTIYQTMSKTFVVSKPKSSSRARFVALMSEDEAEDALLAVARAPAGMSYSGRDMNYARTCLMRCPKADNEEQSHGDALKMLRSVSGLLEEGIEPDVEKALAYMNAEATGLPRDVYLRVIRAKDRTFFKPSIEAKKPRADMTPHEREMFDAAKNAINLLDEHVGEPLVVLTAAGAMFNDSTALREVAKLTMTEDE